FVATQDTFGESGTEEELMDKYGLNNKAIEDAVVRVKNRK
ncbi:MAG: transketolase family protein, partial [Pricia sp.]